MEDGLRRKYIEKERVRRPAVNSVATLGLDERVRILAEKDFRG